LRPPRSLLLPYTTLFRSLRAASPSNIASAPATAVAYDQKLGGASSLLFAGQMSYDQDAPGGGIASVWLPSGTLGAGPHTALVLRSEEHTSELQSLAYLVC